MSAESTSLRSTVSVVMPNYNHGKYLARAMGAILGQSRSPDEVVVVDDGSIDDSVEILERIAAKHPNVRLLKNESNKGVLFSVHRALEHVTGEYVVFASADDELLPDFMEKSVAILTEYPTAGLSSTRRQSVDENGVVIIPADPWIPCDRPCWLSPQQMRETIVSRGISITNNSAMFRKSALDEFLPFRPELLAFSDGFAAHCVALKHGSCFLPEILSSRLVSAGQFAMRGRSDPDYALGVSEAAANLMAGEYRELWPQSFVSEYRAASGRMLTSAIRQEWRREVDITIHNLEILFNAQRAPLSRLYLFFLKSGYRAIEAVMAISAVVAYPPSRRSIIRRLKRLVRRS